MVPCGGEISEIWFILQSPFTLYQRKHRHLGLHCKFWFIHYSSLCLDFFPEKHWVNHNPSNSFIRFCFSRTYSKTESFSLCCHLWNAWCFQYHVIDFEIVSGTKHTLDIFYSLLSMSSDRIFLLICSKISAELDIQNLLVEGFRVESPCITLRI